MSNNKFIKEKEILNKLLQSLLDKNIEQSERRTKEQLSILSSSRENISKMSIIISDFKKKIHFKLNSKRKSFCDKDVFNKSNKFFALNRTKIESNFSINNTNHLNKKMVYNNNQNNKGLYKSKSKKDNISKSKSKSKKVNYYKNIQNNYSINLYSDKIIISNDNKNNRHNPKFNLKKINTMFSLYKKGIKNKILNDNSLTTNLTSRHISNNNSLLDIKEVKSKSIRKKSAYNINKNANNIFNKKEKKIIRKKTPCKNNNKKQSIVDNLKINEEISNDKFNHSINFKNLNQKEEKIINDIMTLNSTINNDDLIITNNNLFSLDEENYDNIIKNVLTQNNNNLNVKKELNYNKSINNEYFNYIFDYLTKGELLRLRGISKSYNHLIINYFIKKIEDIKCKINKKISNLKINKDNIKENDKIKIDSFQFNKTSEKAINLLNEKLLSQLFYSNKIPNNDILLIYKIFFNMINHPIKDINLNEKGKFWENCRFYFIKESDGKIGNLLFDIIKEKKICLNKANIYNIFKLIENNVDKINPSYISKICGTTGLFVFFIKDILDFLGMTNDKNNIYNSFIINNTIIESLNEKLYILKNYHY